MGRKRPLRRFVQAGRHHLYSEAAFAYRRAVKLTDNDRSYEDKVKRFVVTSLTPETHFGWMPYDEPGAASSIHEEGVNGHTFMLSDFGHGNMPEVSSSGFFGQMISAIKNHTGASYMTPQAYSTY